MRAVVLSLLPLVALGLSSCGEDACDPSTSSPFTGTLTITSANPGAVTCLNTHTVVFTAAGAGTQSVSAAGGDCVTFRNDDTVSHWPESDPHPSHGQCPELNSAAALGPGQSFTTPVLSGPKTCGWHDHLNPPVSGCIGGGGGGGY